MQAIISPSIEVSPSMKHNIEEAFQKIEGVAITSDHPTVYIERSPSQEYKVKFQIRYRGELLFAEAKGLDFRTSLLAAKKNLIRLILKRKQKLIKHSKHKAIEKQRLVEKDIRESAEEFELRRA